MEGYFCSFFLLISYGGLLLHIVFIDILDLDNTNIFATNPSPSSGGSTKLSCAVNANPKVIPSQWLWKKNGIQILSGSSELTLQNVTQNDSANYECLAESSLGSASSILRIMVQCKVLWCFQGVVKGCIGNKWIHVEIQKQPFGGVLWKSCS